ncbi:hypothetical protein JOM56_014229 [Amanita muscaria]
MISSSRASKSKRAENIHGIDPEWELMVKQRADQRKIGKLLTNVSITDNSDSMAQFGGPIPEGQTDDVEANAIKENKTPHILSLNSGQKPYSIVKIQDNPTVPRTIKEARGGHDKWMLKHLGDEKRVQEMFTEAVIPLARKKAGELEPWTSLDVDDTTARLQNWRNTFAQNAMESVDLLINQHKESLNTKELVAAQINAQLQKVPIKSGSELNMYAYQWHDWNNGVNSEVRVFPSLASISSLTGFAQSDLVLRTFALAHLAALGDYDDFSKEKPVGALILAMQAVGRALEHWTTGEKLDTKPPAFSADNYGDTFIKKEDSTSKSKLPGKRQRLRRATAFVSTLRNLGEPQWKSIIDTARRHIEKPRPKKSNNRIRSSSATAINDEELEDPDADFVMDLN